MMIELAGVLFTACMLFYFTISTSLEERSNA